MLDQKTKRSPLQSHYKHRSPFAKMTRRRINQVTKRKTKRTKNNSMIMKAATMLVAWSLFLGSLDWTEAQRGATFRLPPKENQLQEKRSLFTGGPPKTNWVADNLGEKYEDNRWQISGLQGVYRSNGLQNGPGGMDTHRTYTGSVVRGYEDDDEYYHYGEDDDYYYHHPKGKYPKTRPGEKDYEYIEAVPEEKGKGYYYYDDDYYLSGKGKGGKNGRAKKAKDAVKRAKKDKKDSYYDDYFDEEDCYEVEEDCQTIAEIACETEGFETLCSLVLETGLGKALSEEVLSVFAPNNDAFDAVGTDVLASLTLDEVAFILAYHTVEGAVFSDDLVCEAEVEMANGLFTQTQCLDDGSIFQMGTGNTDVNAPQIIAVDIQACNGVVHVVDNVILPAEGDAPPKDDDYYYNKEKKEKTNKGYRHLGGKGSESSKSSKSDKKRKSDKKKPCPKPPAKFPTESPRPTDSNDMPSNRPPSPTQGPEPSAPTPFTPSPTDSESTVVNLRPYAIQYEPIDARQPTRAELDAVTGVTAQYLEEFMFDRFSDDTFTIFDDFITRLVTSSFFESEELIIVDYDSTARINPFSTVVPTSAQLNSALVDAFTGVDLLVYEAMLRDELGSNNVFSGATVTFLFDDSPVRVVDGVKRGITGIGIAAAAVAFTVLAAGAVIYKRRQGEDENTELDKLNKSNRGDMTVAGETFAGETYDGTASVSGTSVEYARRNYQDEDSSRRSNLRSIPENEGADSVTPSFGRAQLAALHEKDNEDEVDDIDSTAGDEDQSTMSGRAAWRADVSSNRAYSKTRPSLGSFEDMALQGPTHGGLDNVGASSSSSQDEAASQISESELSQFVASKEPPASTERSHSTLDIKSLLSFESTEEKSPSVSSGLSIRDNSSRRPRTVAEIEALLSADLDQGTSDENMILSEPTREKVPRTTTERSTNRPRTVEEIENLLTEELKTPTLELAHSDEMMDEEEFQDEE